MEAGRIQDALYSTWWYDGYDEDVLKLAYRLKRFHNIDSKGDEYFSRFEHLPQEYANKLPEDFWSLVWSPLVLLFGDYGTSPRGGWIDQPYRAYEFIKECALNSCLYDDSWGELDWLLSGDSWVAEEVKAEDLNDQPDKITLRFPMGLIEENQALFCYDLEKIVERFERKHKDCELLISMSNTDERDYANNMTTVTIRFVPKDN